MDELPDDALFSISVSPEKGRHAVAKTHIPLGRSVLQADALASVLYGDKFTTRCCHCMATSSKPLLCCQTTKLLRFCSKDCQREAWTSNRSLYKQEMRAFTACSPRVPPATCHLAAKVIWHKMRGSGSSWWDSSAAFDSLESHWSNLDDERKEAFVQMAVVARDFALKGLDGESKEAAQELPDLRQVAELIASLSCNAHTICDEELRPLGVGIYPLGAMINHSCQPNCIQFFGRKGRIDFRACKEANEGDELTIAYVDLAATRQERREALAYSYRFDLNSSTSLDLLRFKTGRSCPLRALPLSQSTFSITDFSKDKDLCCFLLVYSASVIPPWPQDEIDVHLSGVLGRDSHSLCGGLMVSTAVVDQRSWDLGDKSDLDRGTESIEIEVSMWGSWCSHNSVALATAQDCATACHLLSRKSGGSNGPGQTVEDLSRALALIEGLPVSLDPRHLLRMRINTLLLKALIDQGNNWMRALQVARHLQPIYQSVYPKTSLNLILHDATLAKLELLVGDPSKAMESAQKALAAWKSITPPRAREGGVGDQLLDTLRECERGTYIGL